MQEQASLAKTHRGAKGAQAESLSMWIKSMELLWFAAIIGLWVLLQAVILPKFGIST